MHVTVPRAGRHIRRRTGPAHVRKVGTPLANTLWYMQAKRPSERRERRTACPANRMSQKWEVCTMILGGGTVDITAISRTAFGTTVHVPYVSLAATDGTHKVVIDTGAREVDVVKKPHAHRWPEEEMENVLRACMGWSLEDVDTVINTHLHYDHCGGNFFFPNASFYVQRREWEAAWNHSPYEAAYYDCGDFCKTRIPYSRWHFVDGEEEIFPGLRVMLAPGHTHGSQIVLLDTREGDLCFPGDTFTCAFNLEHNIQPFIVVDDRRLFQSMDLVRQVAQRIVFSHDDQIKTGMRSGFYEVPDPWYT